MFDARQEAELRALGVLDHAAALVASGSDPETAYIDCRKAARAAKRASFDVERDFSRFLDTSRKFVVTLRHGSTGQFGPFDFVGGVATIEGGRQLFRFVGGMGLDVESVEEVVAVIVPRPPPRWTTDASESGATVDFMKDGSVVGHTADGATIRIAPDGTETITEPALPTPEDSSDAATAPVDRSALARDLFASGLTWRQVGEKLGVTGDQARGLARRGAKPETD